MICEKINNIDILLTDKSPSIWDHYVHTKPDSVIDLSSGDIACDSYNQWQKDVEIASDMGLHFYR